MPNTTALGAHIDSQQEVVAGLIYCRADEDRGQGGDLALYKLKDEIGDKFMSIKESTRNIRRRNKKNKIR